MAQQEALPNGQPEKPSASSPVIPWRTRIALSFVSVVTDYSRRQNGTVNRTLLGIFGLKTSANPNPVNGVKSFDVTVDPSRNLWFRLFVPTTDESRNLSSLPIIVFFHGGGFVYLSADTKAYDAVCRRFARKCPAVVVSVNYRLAPEHRYPAQYDDGFDVLKFLDNEKNRELLPENANLSCCFLAGDSAGGNLAHHVSKRASELTSTFDALKAHSTVLLLSTHYDSSSFSFHYLWRGATRGVRQWSIGETISASSPGIPWRTRIALSFVSVVTGYSRRPNGTVNRKLLGIFGLKTSANPNPVNGVKSFDVTVDPSRDLWFRLFVATTDESRNLSSISIIVFFHGGGFVYLSPDTKTYDAVSRGNARPLLSPLIIDWLRNTAILRSMMMVLTCSSSLTMRVLPENANLSCCFLAGDSAGGNLAHHVAKRASGLTSTFDAPKVIGLVAIQPFFGGEERTEAELKLVDVDALISVRRTDWMWNAFLPPGEGMNRDHEVINVSGPRAVDISKLDNFPATMVVVGGFDPLKDWQRRYYEWLKKSGKNVHLSEYPTMVHAFYIFPEVPESTQLILEVKDFIHKQCSKVVKN